MLRAVRRVLLLKGEIDKRVLQAQKGRWHMTSDFVVGIMAESIKVTLLISAPVLIVGLVVGVVISLFQAVTQVQEMTLVFVPKIMAVMITLIAALPWMLNILISFTHNLFVNIPAYIK
jgi:flagellar biosynthesis protein FliQ